ncbi:hypothetical protein [Bacteroides caecimuris]|uniref:hypothetical protein n=1 Tax=Bacteroides caecimuris TaxID=1796613 RepID=UPI0015D59DA8|nr:hypothetical protein [Bacteroides caecimuris]
MKIETTVPDSKIGVKPFLSPQIGVKRHDGDLLVLTILIGLFTICWILAFLNLIGIDI